MDRDGLSKHRREALADGIFAVAMTLLVVALKLPEHTSVHMSHDLMVGVANLIPKFVAWIISFFVLGIFWFSHHRLFHSVRLVDAKLVWLNIVDPSFVSLMPFSSAIVGEYPQFLFSQAFCSANQMMLATLSLLISGHVFAQPGLWSTPHHVRLLSRRPPIHRLDPRRWRGHWHHADRYRRRQRRVHAHAAYRDGQRAHRASRVNPSTEVCVAARG